MTTYVYETIPQKAGEKPRYHEIRQRMSEPPLTKHPDSGEPIRRVVLGGFGVLSSGKASQAASAPSSACCGPSCGCH
jgi:predicted nucleic acid-binding Zn ribbon protein